MHPSIHEQISKQRMETLQHKAAVAQLMHSAKKDLDNKTGNNSHIHLLWYLLYGMRISTPNQKQGEEYSIARLQAHLNAIIRVVGLAALGLGLLIGGLLHSSFGLAPIVLLASIILMVVSLPILMRSASILSKHNQVPYRR